MGGFCCPIHHAWHQAARTRLREQVAARNERAAQNGPTCWPDTPAVIRQTPQAPAAPEPRESDVTPSVRSRRSAQAESGSDPIGSRVGSGQAVRAEPGPNGKRDGRGRTRKQAFGAARRGAGGGGPGGRRSASRGARLQDHSLALRVRAGKRQASTTAALSRAKFADEVPGHRLQAAAPR